MLNNIPVINFLIFAAGIGIIIAMIYTNIQRSALSSFINALIKKECTNEDSALTMRSLGLTGLKGAIAASGAKKLFGLKKAVVIVYPEDKEKSDTLEDALEGKHYEKYYLSEECDTELLLKKYNYKALSVRKMILLCTATLIIVIVAAFFTDKILEHVFTKKLEKPQEEVTEEQQNEEELKDNDTEESKDSGEESSDGKESSDSTESEDITSENDNNTAGPSIPLE
ncbi:MAG: hypothetical protein E7600_04375 [Ruminococcaceae bacterium]|nr:hypothetical protein [Oscillospiraceae bacterium]